MKNNVPFDVAFELDDLTRRGWCIILTEMSGTGVVFDWGRMAYKEA
ncbi:MAG: hypothetical protein JWO52_4040 [Gammaproteobacteria bacterium]|nr:hypothetical protein [Gammaproteobacteria bacterium]